MNGRAGFGPRLLGAFVDGLLLAVANGLLRGLLGEEPGQGLGLVLGFVYYGYFEGSPSGQTVGKRVAGIRVIDSATSGPIGIGRALLRNLARFLSVLPLFLGYLWMLWDREKQTWHDKIASTYVVPVTDYPVDEWPGPVSR